MLTLFNEILNQNYYFFSKRFYTQTDGMPLRHYELFPPIYILNYIETEYINKYRDSVCRLLDVCRRHAALFSGNGTQLCLKQ